MPARNLQPARQPGRPTKIDDPCREVPERDAAGNQTGVRTVSVSESILADISSGLPKMAAVKRTGITMETFYDWERRGRGFRTHPPLDPQTRKPRRLTAREHRLIRFSVDLDQAEAEGHGRYFGAQATAALRPIETTKRVTVTETDKDGNVVTTRTTEETVVKPPSENAQRFILSHRYRDDWAERVEVTGEAGAPLVNPDAVAAGILEKLRSIQSGRPTAEIGAGAIDADAEEITDPED